MATMLILCQDEARCLNYIGFVLHWRAPCSTAMPFPPPAGCGGAPEGAGPGASPGPYRKGENHVKTH